jgi:hypothetical protein
LDVKTPVEIKKAFRDAFVQRDYEKMERFCIGFLGGAMPQITDAKVYVVGDTTP